MDNGTTTILLVEDEAILSYIKKLQLEKEGYKVLGALTGEKALDVFASASGTIDLVLMDIDLGTGMDGTETARKMLARFDVPLIFLSSHSEKDFLERAAQVPNYGYVFKNSSFTVLDAAIKTALTLFREKHSGEAETAAISGRTEAQVS